MAGTVPLLKINRNLLLCKVVCNNVLENEALKRNSFICTSNITVFEFDILTKNHICVFQKKKIKTFQF